ncbi:hypothetical protein BCR34DRAFT_628578 [Clohesyomyces aquaticus]|uniref:Heme haloperoxidase family profile domain-containing protein n=1 Tax=Clohesyomyces aquaticus TaxID=1231657 RepID=A0A1Y1YHU2_9PLEO|nr:hypothetical protein BCR34DRAFT_628578 [Clohesyomyces aquaticus]
MRTTCDGFCSFHKGILQILVTRPRLVLLPNKKVPAHGDTAHYYNAPGPNDIRGPCPADDDIVTEKPSIGCDATSRTTAVSLLGKRPGLDGHNKFEGDTSLTRNDYFLANDDNYDFNGTLFSEMKAVVDRVILFGPLSFLLYGAASFLYELFPSYGNRGISDLAIMKFFFGAVEGYSAPGGWRHVPERIPDKWFSRRAPYTNNDVTIEILALYTAYPKSFGGNFGTSNFDTLQTSFGGIITDGKLLSLATAADIECLLYQLGTLAVPHSTELDGGKLNPVFKNPGCALKPDQTLG